MLRHIRVLAAHSRYMAVPIAAVAGVTTAALVGMALAKTFALQVARDAKVTDTAGMTATESIVTTRRGAAVYYLSADSKRHPKCTKSNGCFQFWPPVTVSSGEKLSKAPGIKGKLGVWRRSGLRQVTLGGRPLYTFSQDHRKRVAGGEGIVSFHGTWHVVKASSPHRGTSTTTPSSSTTPSTTTPTTTTTPCLYLPCY